ncbi:MAG: porin family protein [Bacteroidota bacterium]
MFQRAILLVVLCFCAYAEIRAQETPTDLTYDEKYLEDQFYTGFSYNFLLNKPDGVVQQSLSYNFQIGFIKDIPLNQGRNFGIGMGIGYATNSYFTNMVKEKMDEVVTYRFASDIETLNRSKLETNAIEFPFELRWRTSNPIDYKFWRVYTGFKAEYLFSRRAKIVFDDKDVTFSNPDIEQWQFGWMINFGYNTWNLHFYWALSDLLGNNATFNDDALTIRPIRIGVIFYIL